mmetsp:Transcript_67455/g.140581  ORF Transcript_67455/g.140581 Transcript_67455/m.140581 type:complete len:213 (-) Transcript_67455:618-1256(-)
MPALRKHAATNLAIVHHAGGVLVRGVRLEHDEGTTLLRREDGKCLGGVARRDDAISNLRLEVRGRLLINNVGERSPVAKGAHGVGVARAQVRERALRKAVRRLKRLLLNVRERHGDGGACGGDVLEGGGSGEAERLLDLLDERPGVERVQQVDVAGLAVQDLEGEGGAIHRVDIGGELVGVAAVLEGERELVRARRHCGLLLVLRRKPRRDR